MELRHRNNQGLLNRMATPTPVRRKGNGLARFPARFRAEDWV
jgi:hypothetical protein